eukprot:15460903-Alexandrium_andersonii.AAC.2
MSPRRRAATRTVRRSSHALLRTRTYDRNSRARVANLSVGLPRPSPPPFPAGNSWPGGCSEARPPGTRGQTPLEQDTRTIKHSI